METIISAGAIALTFTFIVLFLQNRKAESVRVEETHGALQMVGIQIICGDCSGDGDNPIKTYMDRYGNCVQCGGHSYLIASSLALNSAALKASRLIQAQSAASGGRVRPFEARPRTALSQKIAV